MASTARITQEFVEALSKGNGPARITQEFVEVLGKGTGQARITQMFVEVLCPASSKARWTQEFIEVLTDPGFTTYDRDADNTITFSQTATPGHYHDESVPQTLTLTSTANVSRNTDVGQTITFSDTAVSQLVFNKGYYQDFDMTQTAIAGWRHDEEVDDTLVMDQFAGHPIFEEVPQTLDLDQDASAVRARHFSASSTLTIVQDVDVSADHDRIVTQGFVINQAATRTISHNLIVNQTITFSQTAVGLTVKPASNTITFSQDATYTVGKHVHQTIIITQSVGIALTILRSIHTVFPMGQSATAEKTYRRTLTDTIVFTQEALAELVHDASNILVFAQDASAYSAKPAFNTLDLEELLILSKSIGTPADHTVDFEQSAFVTKSYGLSATNAFGMSQFVHGDRILIVSASNTLTILQDLVRTRTLESVNQSLTISQTLACQKRVTPDVEQSFEITQDVQIALTKQLDISQTLIFLPSFEKPIGNGQTVSVPTVQVVKVHKIVTLQTDDAVITLPSPEFGDREAYVDKLNIKRSMNGVRYIYKRTAPTSKLAYDFVMDRIKAIELRSFILANNSKMIRMENWKGEIWMVLLTNNPFSTTEEARWAGNLGNKSRVTLEFEGVRVN